MTISMLLLAVAARLPAQGLPCAETKFPADLPAPSALVDSLHAIDDLGAFADPAKPMVFSVFYGTGDSVAQVRALDKSDAAAAVTLANYVRHAAPREFWAFRVQISGGATPALTLGRSLYCPPAAGTDGARARITGYVAVEGSGNPRPIPSDTRVGSRGESDVIVEALISPEGRVVRAQVVKSSGDMKTDERVLADFRQQKFLPAKLDGSPIQGLYRPRDLSPRP